MTESELAAAIAYVENRDGFASKDDYKNFDKAAAVVLQAAQNLLDIAQDEETRNVPVTPLNEMVHAGMDMYDATFGKGPYTASGAIYIAMVGGCPRDARLPKKDNPYNINPPF